jgi:hypothetical protein
MAKYTNFVVKLHEIQNAIKNIDSRLEVLASKYSYSPSDLITICGIAKMRKDMLEKIKECHKNSTFMQHTDYNQKQIKLLLSTMAANLCNVGSKEICLWKEFLENPGFMEGLRSHVQHCAESVKKKARFVRAEAKKEQMAQLAEAKAIEKKINEFTAQASSEAKLLEKLHETALSVSRNRRRVANELEKRYIGRLNGLRKSSPLAHSILEEALIESKTHQEYKRERLPCPDLNYYLNASALLLSLAEMNPGKNPDEVLHNRTWKQGISLQDMLDTQIHANAFLLELFEKYGLGEEIRNYMDHFLYLKAKGFDIESDPVELNKTDYTNTKINVTYWVSVDLAASQRVLNLKLGNSKTILHVPMPGLSLPAEDFLIDRSENEEILGKKYELDYFVPKVAPNDSLADLYVKISEAALQDLPKFRQIQAKIRSKDMKSAHFLSTLVQKEPLAGCVSNTLGENLPHILSAENTLIGGLKAKYPNFEAEAKETGEYAKQKIAMKLMHEINRTLPYWVARCAQKIAEQSKQA